MPSSSPDKDTIEQNALTLLGLNHQSLSKTKARQQFLPLVNELAQSTKAVQITDHEQPVAVLVSYNHWSALLSKLSMLSKPVQGLKFNLMGSVKIIADLESGSQEAAAQFEEAIQKSAETL